MEYRSYKTSRAPKESSRNIAEKIRSWRKAWNKDDQSKLDDDYEKIINEQEWTEINIVQIEHTYVLKFKFVIFSYGQLMIVRRVGKRTTTGDGRQLPR